LIYFTANYSVFLYVLTTITVKMPLKVTIQFSIQQQQAVTRADLYLDW